MSTEIRKYFTIKDAEGNVLQKLSGTADNSWIGRTLTDGSVVASVEQLSNETITRPDDEDSGPTLLERIVTLEAKVAALENA